MAVVGHQPTTKVVRGGSYCFSRNPIYLTGAILQLGIAPCVYSLWVAAMVVGPIALMSLILIPLQHKRKALSKLSCVSWLENSKQQNQDQSAEMKSWNKCSISWKTLKRNQK